MRDVLLDPEILLKELVYISQDRDEEFTKYKIKNLEKKIWDLQNNTRYLLDLDSELSKWDMDLAKEKIKENRIQIDILEIQLDDFKSSIMPAKEKKRQMRDLKKLSSEIYECIFEDELDYMKPRLKSVDSLLIKSVLMEMM